jgi:hypothetical protein
MKYPIDKDSTNMKLIVGIWIKTQSLNVILDP